MNVSKRYFAQLRQNFSTSANCYAKKSYKLVIAGGGSGGCSTAAKFASRLGKGQVAVIEPADMHYYQPMWTLVGAGCKTLEQSSRPMSDVLPKNANWIKSKVAAFDPENSKVTTSDGDEVSYEYLVVALGLQLNYEAIKGLPEAFETPGVCSNYHTDYVTKTLQALHAFKQGNAVFTFPFMPIKCPGAPQKIMYLADYYLRKSGKRDKANVEYYSTLPVIFPVKKYADALWEVVKERNITVNLQRNLVEVNPDKKEAIFQSVENPDEKTAVPYEMLHVGPPCKGPDALKTAEGLADLTGYLDVDKTTLQHVKYKNVFGIGDCTNIPTPKTAAAVAAQSGILERNLTRFMNGNTTVPEYDGYTSCPLVVSPKECIMAEFDFNAPPQPLETFPINQGKPRRSMYFMKAHVMPQLYWNFMLKGNWNGPRAIRKALHLGMSR